MLCHSRFSSVLHRSSPASDQEEALFHHPRPYFCAYGIPSVVRCATSSSLLILMNKLDLVLPEEVFQIVWEALVSKTESIQYAKVFLPLSALLEGDFFNIYIKSGTFYRIYLPYISNLFSDIIRQCSHPFRRTSRCRQRLFPSRRYARFPS